MENSCKHQENLSHRVRPGAGSDPAPVNTTSNRQAGQSSAYVILLIIVIIFAVMMSGGGSSLFSGNLPSSVTDTPEPSTPVGTSPTSSVSPTPDPKWTIDAVLSSCQIGKSPFKSGNITAKGNSNGYLSLEIEYVTGTWTVDATSAFTSPSWNYTINLPNDSGYDTKNWRLRLFSGGSQTSGVWSGGTEKAVKTAPPTGC